MKLVILWTVICCTLFIVGTGCQQDNQVKEDWVYGKVIKISGSLAVLSQSSGAMFGNESVQLGYPSLVYTVRTVGGELYTLDIQHGYKVSRDTLLDRVCVGTGITFLTPLRYKSKEEKNTNPNYRVGSITPDTIFVQDPCTK